MVGGGQPAGQRRALTGTARPSLRARLHRPGKGGHRVPQTPAAERVHDARASPHRYCWLATGPHPRPPERHAHSQQPTRSGGRAANPLNQRYNAQHHTPQGGAVQPLADPVWGPALRRRVRGRRGTQADALAAHALPAFLVCPGRAVPANPVRAARLRPALCAHSVRRLPGAPAGRTSTRLGAGSPPPLSAEGTLQAKAAACGLPAGMRTPAVTSTFARREHSYRARRAAGSAEVDDQAQNVRWRNPACCHRAAMRIIIGRGGQKPPGKDGAGAGLPAERSCPPGTDRLAPGLDLANLDQITPAARGSRCMPAAIGCTRGCDGPQGSGAAVPLTAGQLWFVSGPGRLPLAKSAITGCRAERCPSRTSAATG